MSDIVTVLAVIVSFSVIITLIAKRKNFALVILLGCLLLAAVKPQKIPDVLVDTISDMNIISLILIVVLIKLLATILQESGEMKDLINVLRNRLSYRQLLVIIPSVLGLLPVPGGALLSAPLIDEQSKKIHIKKEEMMFINLWYRHIWFMIFPLATPLILLADLSDINIYSLIILQFPLFIISFAVGLLIVKNFSGKEETELNGSYRGLIPILIPVSIAIPLSYFMSTYSAFLISLPIGILVALMFANKKDISFLRKGISVSLAVAIFAIMLLKNIIFSIGATEIISSFLSSLSPVLIIASLSFIVGLLTAHNLAAIGILYPILSPFLIGEAHLVGLLYVSSFMGYLISPIHPCVVLTYDYFRPKFTCLYRILLPSSLLILFAATLFYGLL
jgi:integral membrane protein (TIGR00529 family)